MDTGHVLNISPMPQAHTLISSQCDFFKTVVDWRTEVKRVSFPDEQLYPAASRHGVPEAPTTCTACSVSHSMASFYTHFFFML